MLAFTIKVTKCSECPHCQSDVYYPSSCMEIADERTGCRVFKENQNGITSSCPMFNEAKEC